VTVTEGDCSASDQISVTIQPLPIFDLGEDRLACPGTSEQLVAEGVPLEADLTWGHGPTGASTTVTESGTYTAVASWNGCFHYDAVQVAFAEPLTLDLPAEVRKCPEDTVRFDVGLPPNLFPVAYDWSTGATTPVVSLFDHGEYTVVVSNACESLQAAVAIELESCACQLHVPTAFTPDNDGVNDAFRPEFNCPVDRYVLRIYNRWGELVFATEDPAAFWYGQVPDGAVDEFPFFAGNGVYTWQIELNYFQQGDARASHHEGHLLMIR
jgi:gliding motility-associated-like protein